MKVDSSTALAVMTVCVLCVFTVIFGVFGSITQDSPSDNRQEKIDAEMLSEINQLGLLYQKNKDTEKFDKQMKLMQEKQKEITSRYLGVSISEIYIKENWNFPFKNPSDVVIHNPELRKPVCNIPENIPVHLQNIRQSKMFQMFAEKYSQHQLMTDISDERYTSGLIHYDFIATSEDESFTASTWFHLDSCTAKKMYSPYLLSCKDTTNGNSTYTRIKSEIVSSLNNNDDFCTIQLEPWHQDLRSYQAKISKEYDDNDSGMNDVIDSSDFTTMNKFTTERKRLALITDIMRYYESEYTDYERMQKDLAKYNRMFGDIPKELQEIMDKRK